MLIESTMRVSELRGLTVGQVRIERPKKGDAYTVIQVQGKTGPRTIVAGGSFPDVFERRAKGLKPGTLLWPHIQRDAFRELLIAAKLRTDAFGNSRNLKIDSRDRNQLSDSGAGTEPESAADRAKRGYERDDDRSVYARRLSAELGAEQLARSTLEQ